MFRSIVNNRMVRYFFSAGTATGADVMVYFICYNFLFMKADIDLFQLVVISAPTASLVISYSCGLLTNFLITKYFVFAGSDLKGIHQLMRYILVALVVLILNYLLMSFMIKVLGWYPTISRVISAVTVGLLSFLIHKIYSFRGST